MEPATDNAEPLPLGQVLAAERERQGLSRAEVAQRLHMSAWQVEALEGNDYGRLPKGTFLRGFARNYAKVLGIDPNSVLTRLAEMAPHGPAPAIVVPTQNIRFDPIGDRISNPYVKAAMLATVALAMGFAVMYWWLFIRTSPPANTLSPALSQGRGSTELSQGRGSNQPMPQQIAAVPVTAPEPVVPTEAPKEVPPPEPKAAPPAKVAAPVPAAAPPALVLKPNERRIKLRFKGESWVEVKDRSGKVLLSKLNARGSEAEVSGRPPFNVIIGNAPDVQVLYEDREFPLEPHTKVAVARFTVE